MLFNARTGHRVVDHLAFCLADELALAIVELGSNWAGLALLDSHDLVHLGAGLADVALSSSRGALFLLFNARTGHWVVDLVGLFSGAQVDWLALAICPFGSFWAGGALGTGPVRLFIVLLEAGLANTVLL